MGWGLSGNATGGEKANSHRSHAERAQEELEAHMHATGGELAEEDGDKPGTILNRMITVQNHMDARFAAKTSSLHEAYFRARQAISKLMRFDNGYEAALYQKDVVELIVEQRSLTALLMGYFSGSIKRMQLSYENLQEQRLGAAKQLQKEGMRYERIEKSLEKLNALEAMVAEETPRNGSKSAATAETLYVQGNLLVEKQKLSTESAEAAIKSFRAFNRAKDIKDYQLTVIKVMEVLTNAYGSLEEVAMQQEIAQSGLSAFVEGESSIAAANDVVNALSANIIGTGKTINEAAIKLKRLAVNIGTKEQSSESANSGVKSLYTTLHGTNKGELTKAHEFMRQMREKPVSELLKMHGNDAAAAKQQDSYSEKPFTSNV